MEISQSILKVDWQVMYRKRTGFKGGRAAINLVSDPGSSRVKKGPCSCSVSAVLHGFQGRSADDVRWEEYIGRAKRFENSMGRDRRLQGTRECMLNVEI
jgi:hypothetical protein